MSKRPLRSRRSAAFFGGVGVLLLLVALCAVVERAWIGQIASDAGAPDRERSRALAEVQEALGGVLAEMERRAERVASQPEIRRALARDSARADGQAIDAVTALGVGPHEAVEVYARDGTRVAWDGFAFPRRRGPQPDTLTTRTVIDAAGRRALVLWRPVVVDTQRVGAVRIVTLAQAAVPVRNQYLQDFDLTDAWRASVSRPFSVRFVPSASPPTETSAPLQGAGGTLLGWVDVPRPSVRVLESQARATLRGLMAFWATLLWGWLLAGLSALWLQATRVAERADTRGRWGAAALAVLGLGAAGIGVRYALLRTDVPVRWLDAARTPAALFDPTYLASDFGGGLFRSAGDLALTAAVALALATSLLAFALRMSVASRGRWGGPLRAVLGSLAAAAVAVGVVWLVDAVVREITLNTALAFGEHGGVVIDGLLLTALGSLAAIAAAALVGVAAAMIVAWMGGARWWSLGAAALAAGGFAMTQEIVLWPALALVIAAGLLAAVLVDARERWAWPLSFRGVLLGALVTAPIVYGFMQDPLALRTRERVASAARVFADQRDRRVAFALDQVLAEARADDALLPAILDALAARDSLRRQAPVESDVPADSVATDGVPERQTLDELAESLVTTSLLGSLADVATDLQFVAPSGETLGQYARDGTTPLASADPLSYPSMRARYAERGETGYYRASASARGSRGQTRTAAIGPIRAPDDEVQAWVYVLTTPRTARLATETPFPRVLAPSELFGTDDEGIAYAEYADGVLVRYRGGAAPSRLSAVGLDSLARARGVWLNETIEGRPTQAYYVRAEDDPSTVVVARVGAADGPDALFLLLRLSLAALAAGAVVFALGIPLRVRAGLFPAQRTRFRDRVLNRFLVVGLASVTLTGVVGQQVIEEQNRQAVRDTLRQRLQRAEALLAADAADGTAAAARALEEGVRPDAIAANLGVDVHLYRGAQLLESSRRQLVRQSLIEPRLPGRVYRALYLDGDPYAFHDDRIGTFTYTTGYKAIADSTGQPVGAVAVPTLPEQAAIEAGRARMVAYLFGGLLVLLLAIAGLAALLAGQLTRPFGRLRRGLQAVGAGEVDEPIPVETRDEVGQLVETFNAMQAQLVESRQKLAEQERELAWSEMARQVAHEIKNPLMPMKLSVQHLQRVFRPVADEATADEKRFAGQFERTTGMLIDQIETLNQIASEFSRFARMPMRNPETVDLGGVAREAAALFEGEAAARDTVAFDVALADVPLPVLADPEELRRVVVNLLTNALQALPPDRDGRIGLRTRRDGGVAVLAVQDDGTGIAEEVQPKVFQPSFSTKTSGMGLGLAISRRAVEAVGGTIAFSTEAGAGTTFTVRLPLLHERVGERGDGTVAPSEMPTPEPAGGGPPD